MLNSSRKTTQKISSLVDNFAKIYISEKAYMQMSYIINNCDIEVGWLATVNREGNDFHIEECFLVEQEAHSTTCELKEDALNKFALKLIEDNKIDIYDKLKCWCHSHVNMSVFPSGQDDEQMNLFSDNDYFLRGIGNKKGDMKFDIFDFKNNLLIEDVGWEIARDENIVNRIKALKEELALLTNLEDKALENNIKSELKDKVKKISYTTSYANGYKYYDYKNNYNYKDKYKDKYKDDNHNFIFDTKSNSYKKFDDDKYNKYTFTKEDDFTVVNYSDEFDDDYHIYDYLKDDTNSGESIFDYFLYDELEEAYQSCNYSYKNMFYWLKENITGLTDEQAHEFLEELDSIKHNNSFEMI